MVNDREFHYKILNFFTARFSTHQIPLHLQITTMEHKTGEWWLNLLKKGQKDRSHPIRFLTR